MPTHASKKTSNIWIWCLFSFPIIIVAYLLVLATDIDKPLPEAITAELAWPEPDYDETNAFYAFMGLTHLNEADSLVAAGIEIVEKDYESYLAFDPSVIYSKNPALPDFFSFDCNLKNSACTKSNASQLNHAHQWRVQHQMLIDAVEKIVNAPSFHEQIALPHHYRASWRLFLSVRTYKRIEASHFLLQDKPEMAVSAIAPYLQFCRNLLKTSVSLISRRTAIACVANDMRMIADWYVSRPEHIHVLTSALQDWLKPISLEEIRMRSAILNEVRHAAQSYKSFRAGLMENISEAKGGENR
jgi:hypothetical protein